MPIPARLNFLTLACQDVERMLAAGIALGLSFFGGGGVLFGFWLVLGGLALIVGVAIERTRYRSEAAELGSLAPGPGGGEPERPGPPFEATAEVFIDPTTNRRMALGSPPRRGLLAARREAFAIPAASASTPMASSAGFARARRSTA